MKRLGRYLYNTFLVLKSWFDNPKRMGALFPSFTRTAKMLAGIIKDNENVRVVELGAGTGPVTDQIIASGVREDNFYTVEFDPKLCATIQARHPGLHILNIDAATMIEHLPKAFVGNTDYVISTLPLIVLGKEKAKEIINSIFAVLKPGGVYIQITYTPWRPSYMREIGLKVTQLCVSWINLPPTFIWRICPSAVGLSPAT